jgi:hypothetical protein
MYLDGFVSCGVCDFGVGLPLAICADMSDAKSMMGLILYSKE